MAKSPVRPAPRKPSPPKADGSVVSSEKKKAAAEEEALPDAEQVAETLAALRLFAEDKKNERIRAFLQRLSAAPPQVLLLEGGYAHDRLQAARFWSLLLNCERIHRQGHDLASFSGGAGTLPGRALPAHGGDEPEHGASSDGADDCSTQTRQAAQVSLLPGLAPPAAQSLSLGALLVQAKDTNAPAEPEPRAAPGSDGPGADKAGAEGAGTDEAGATEAAAPEGAGLVAADDAAGSGPPLPCLRCPACVRMATHMHRDLFFLDGRQASIKIDEVRALKSVLGEPPREAVRRVVIFCEAQALGEAAANSLLKSFEEPAPATSFVLLAPQRERLLPTLVSRSFTLTLPWPLQEDAARREQLAPWEAALCTFIATGRDFFDRSGSKGAVDAPLVHALTGLCRRALAACLLHDRTKGPAPESEGLEKLFARLPEARLRMLDEALAECQDSLIYGVNPTLVLEWLATRLYLLMPRR